MSISVDLGILGPAVEARLAAWESDDVATHLFEHDPTIWFADDRDEITNRLGWLTLAKTMLPYLDSIQRYADSLTGASDVVLLGMGGSSLAPEVFFRTWGNAAGRPRLQVLDSTHPDAVGRLADRLDVPTTHFIVSSKSGTTVEPLSFMNYFWELLGAAGTEPAPHFAAISDPGTPLVAEARRRGFAAVFETIPEVGGRYSALTHFGLVPAAVIGIDLTQALRRAGAIAAAARSGNREAGFTLGAVLGEAALAGRDKATWLVSDALAAFPDWVEQLVAESTGKNGTGIVPVAGEPLRPASGYGPDRVFIHMKVAGEPDPHEVVALAAAGHPVVSISVDDTSDMVTEMYRAEVAVALAGQVLGIHPFNQPDVQRAKELARQAMGGKAEGDPITEAYPEQGDPFVAAVADIAGGDDGYLALQAFIAPTPEVTALFGRIRRRLGERSKAATTFGYGPRFLHSTGQLHKGGPPGGRFLQIVDHGGTDIPVPGSDFSFGTLVQAQADGDYRALQAARRRVTRVCLGDDVEGGLHALLDALG